MKDKEKVDYDSLVFNTTSEYILLMFYLLFINR